MQVYLNQLIDFNHNYIIYMDNKSNTYLKFDRNRIINLEYSLNREILRTNRRGAYHCTTIVECNTRKQHGLLVMPIPNFDNTNHVLLSTFDETVIQHGAEFNLGIHEYEGNHFSPMGHKYIREFNCDSLPKTIYRVGGVILSKEKMFSLEENRIMIRYTLIDAHSPTTIRFSPFLAFREINSLTQENININHGYKEQKNGISMCLYSGYPDMFMQFNKPVQFIFNPNWHKNVIYQKDKADGLPYKEDLYVPGYFELPIKKGESIVFSAGDSESNPEELLRLFEEGITQRTPRSSFLNCLKNSAHQFYFRPSKSELYLLNSYPWGNVKAREQFISLTGLTLSVDKPEAFEEVMDTALPTIYQFLSGKPLSGFLKDIDNADVLLWVIRALKKYSNLHRDQFNAKYISLVNKIVDFILKGKHPKLKPTDNGLLYTDRRDGSSSWMDSSDAIKYSAVNRTGYLVEINAFWYNSLMFNHDIAVLLDNKALAEEMLAEATKVKTAFLDTFLNNGGYLYDYVDGGYVDWSVRPNMLLAIALDYPLLDKRQSKSILDIATKELLANRGLRTLSPKSPGFHSRVEGSLNEKVYSSYNGGAWPWLLSPYLEAYLRIFQQSGLSFLDRILIDIEDEMQNGCIGSLSAIYDSSPPYLGHGPISYATNIAGVLYALALQKAYENKY